VAYQEIFNGGLALKV